MRSNHQQKGFTLLEMMMVLLIMALISGVVVVTRPIAPTELRLQARIAELANSASIARYMAVRNGIPVSWKASGDPCDDGQAEIIFYPDGTSSTGPICLVFDDHSINVEFNPITGQIKI